MLIALKRVWRNKFWLHVDRLLPKLDLNHSSAQQPPFHPATAPCFPTVLSFLSSRPGFPATLRWTRLRVRLSRKERRMEVHNATNLNRKSGGALSRADLRFYGELLETRNNKGEMDVFPGGFGG